MHVFRRTVTLVLSSLTVAALLASLGCPSAAGKVTPLPPPHSEIRIAMTFSNPETKDTLEHVIRSCVAIFETKVAPYPALGPKPIVIGEPPDGQPRADVSNIKYEYHAWVTRLDSGYYTANSFELGHELAHNWSGPFRSSLFVESCCTAMSYICADELAKQWKYCPPSPKFASFAANMRAYHDERLVLRALKNYGMENAGQAVAWVKNALPVLVREGKWSRSVEATCAVVIEQILRRHEGRWGALAKLADPAVTTNDMTDFAKWRSAVTLKQRPLVDDLAAMFDKPLRGISPNAAAGSTSPAP
jgi:hypothetical protein